MQPVSESESSQVQQLLCSIFGAPASALFVSPPLMHWKYWEPHPYGPGSRSYASKDGSEIVAHAGGWPFQLKTTETTVAGVHPIDWAASSRVRGSGANLLRQLRTLKDVSLSIGGTGMAQAVVRREGFKAVAAMHMLSFPLHPARQVMNHQRRNWKLPARFLRNTMWRLTAASAPPGWTAEPVAAPEIPPTLFPVAQPKLVVASRSAELFAYLVKCPAARWQAWVVKKNGESRGYFLLSFVPGQARIADAWVLPDSNEDSASWKALYTLARQAAASDGSTAEIVTGTSYQPAYQGAVASGFRGCGEQEVMLYDPAGHLSHANHFHVQFIENDMSFLHEGRIEYVT